MSDKAKSGWAVPITFSSGEIPTPAKLTGFATQTSNAFSLIENALGDVWNNSGDSFFASLSVGDYALMVPNVARMLGQTKLLSPRVPYLSSITEYTHVPLSSDVGNYEWQLSLPPTNGTTFSWGGGAAGLDTSPKSSIGGVVGSGDWYCDRETGWCFFYDDIEADWTCTYTPTVEGDLGENARFNIIPDPNTETSYEFLGCKIAYTNNTDNTQGYTIFLPPRGPLTRTIDGSPQSSFSTGLAAINTSNMSTTPDTTPVLFFQHYDDGGSPVNATTGSYASHYRYNLPKLITDNWSNGSSLPSGMLYLWDHSQSETIISGVSFSAESAASPSPYIVIASGTAMDNWVDTYMASAYSGVGGKAALTQRDNHDPSYYPATGLRLICTGTSVSYNVSELVRLVFNHDHGSSNSLPNQSVSHTQLRDLFDPNDLSGSPIIPPSTLTNDDHPQYLLRTGNTSRDAYSGGMLGDILMCSTNSSGNYQNTNNISNAIYFGDTSGDGGRIRCSGSDTLEISGDYVDIVPDNYLLLPGDIRPKEYSDSYYGTGSGDLGPVRTHIIYPKDCLWIFDNTASNGDIDVWNASTGTREPVKNIRLSYYGTDGWRGAMGWFGAYSAPNGYYCIFNISLPFPIWHLIDITTAFWNDTGSTRSPELLYEVGKITTDYAPQATLNITSPAKGTLSPYLVPTVADGTYSYFCRTSDDAGWSDIEVNNTDDTEIQTIQVSLKSELAYKIYILPIQIRYRVERYV